MSDAPKSSGDLRRGFLYALSGSVLISPYFISGKYCQRGFNLATFCLVWTAATAAWSLGLLAARRCVSELRVPRPAWFSVLSVGVCNAVGLVLLYGGLRRIDPTFTAFIERSHPVMVILLGVVFLRERLRAIELMPLALMLAGGLAGALRSSPEVTVGVVMAFLGYVAFAFQRLFVKSASGRVRTEVIVFYRAAVAMVLVALWTLPLGEIDFDVPAKYWVALVVGVFVSPVMGNYFSFHAYRYISLSRVALVSMIQPLLVLPMAWGFLHMRPTGQELLGGLLILLGASWISWIHLPKSKKRAAKKGETNGIPVP